MFSLYLHIPFCKRKCAYCAFHSTCGTEAEKARYAQGLEKAIRYYGQELHRPLDTLYTGGGTPAMLGGQALAGLIRAAKESFGLQGDAELTVELNPESTTPELLAALKAAGVNRISVGVQSLQDGELERLGRLHNREGALNALKLIFEAGITNVSADVMFGLPGQTAEAFGETLDTLLDLPLTHLSAYALQWEEGTPLYEGGVNPMEEEAEEQLYQLLCAKTKAAGMEHYEVSNFARPGFASRHNSAYWRRTDYLGLGPAAHSFVDGVRYSFEENTNAFLKAPYPLKNSEPVSPEEAYEESIMLGLRMADGVALKDLPQGLDLNRYRDFGAVKNGRFSLNDRGFYLSNTIITEILTK